MLSLVHFLFLFSCFKSLQSLTLSPVEKVLIGKRLSTVAAAIKSDFHANFKPNFVTSNEKQRGGFSSNRQPLKNDVTIIFPGAGGPDIFTQELESNIQQACDDDNGSGSHSYVATYDWKEHCGSILTAAFDSEAVGEVIGRELWGLLSEEGELGELRTVHVVGISVGSFAGNAMARTMCRLREQSQEDSNSAIPYVRLTLLDPFCSRGILGEGFGASNFGNSEDKVDYTLQILNTDDPVPTTNNPLPLCACVDVTSAPERDTFVLPDGESMHCWPLVYYARYWLKHELNLVKGDSKSNLKKRGGIALLRHSDGLGLERGSVIYQ